MKRVCIVALVAVLSLVPQREVSAEMLSSSAESSPNACACKCGAKWANFEPPASGTCEDLSYDPPGPRGPKQCVDEDGNLKALEFCREVPRPIVTGSVVMDGELGLTLDEIAELLE